VLDERGVQQVTAKAKSSAAVIEFIRMYDFSAQEENEQHYTFSHSSLHRRRRFYE
jgi:hypothetical protein